jgi:AcrR family transcriptional regulator
MRSETLAKLTSAALKVFAECGYSGATMKRIAQTAGLSYGLAYHYFPSKADVFRHLVDFALESTIAGMHAVLDQPGSAWERIERWSEILTANALSGESSLYFLIMLQAMTQGTSIPGLLAEINERTSVYFETLAPVIREAQEAGEAKAGDPVVLATAFFSFLQGLALFVFHREALAKSVTPEMLVSVLRNPHPAPGL